MACQPQITGPRADRCRSVACAHGRVSDVSEKQSAPRSLVLFSGGNHVKKIPACIHNTIQVPFKWGHSAVWPCLHVRVESMMTCGAEPGLSLSLEVDSEKWLNVDWCTFSSVLTLWIPNCTLACVNELRPWLSPACLRAPPSESEHAPDSGFIRWCSDWSSTPAAAGAESPCGGLCLEFIWMWMKGRRRLPQRYRFPMDTDTIYSLGVGEDSAGSSVVWLLAMLAKNRWKCNDFLKQESS